MFKRVRYVSRHTRPLTAEQVSEIGEDASRRNAEHGLTGVLMTSGGLFYQVLEGPPAAVDEIYRAILHDPRHTDILLLGVEEEVEAREFPDWSMQTVNLDASSHVRLLPLKALIKAAYEQRRVLEAMTESIERAIWNEVEGR